MKITGAKIALNAKNAEQRDFVIRQGRISFSDTGSADEPLLDLTGFLFLPGLINAHDHLEFNLFPKLGNGPYPNASLWASDVYQPSDSPVKEHLTLSKRARLTWGGLKNLLSGVTTVAHHNPCDDPHFHAAFPVNVIKKFGWAHSLDFSPDLAKRFHATPPDWPFILHAAEGTDERAHSEIARLDALGILSDRTVLVHAIGLDQPDLNLLRTRRSSIVWCPTSNLSTYGRTLSDPVLRSGLNIALGTDSAITAQTDLIDEIALATSTCALTAEEVYEMVTNRSARLLRLNDGQGCIKHNGVADIVAIADHGQTPASALTDLRPELVMVGGEARLLSERLWGCIPASDAGPLQPVQYEGRGRWFTSVDVASLHRETISVLGSEFRLAGRRVSP